MKKKIAVSALLTCGLLSCKFGEVRSLESVDELVNAASKLVVRMQSLNLNDDYIFCTLLACADPVNAERIDLAEARDAILIAKAILVDKLQQITGTLDRVEATPLTAVLLSQQLHDAEFLNSPDAGEDFFTRFLAVVDSVIHDIPTLSAAHPLNLAVFSMLNAFADSTIFDIVFNACDNKGGAVRYIADGLVKLIQTDLPSRYPAISPFAISSVYSARGNCFYSSIIDHARNLKGEAFLTKVLKKIRGYGEEFCKRFETIDKSLFDSSFDCSFGEFYFHTTGIKLPDSLRSVLLQFSLGPIINVCALRDFLFFDGISLRLFEDFPPDCSLTIKDIFDFDFLLEQPESSRLFTSKLAVSTKKSNDFKLNLGELSNKVRVALEKRNNFIEIVSQFLLNGTHFNLIERTFTDSGDFNGYVLDTNKQLSLTHRMFTGDPRFFRNKSPRSTVPTVDAITCRNTGEFGSANNDFCYIFAVDKGRSTSSIPAELAFLYSQYAYEAFAISPVLRDKLSVQLRKEAREREIVSYIGFPYDATTINIADIGQYSMVERAPFDAFLERVKTILPAPDPSNSYFNFANDPFKFRFLGLWGKMISFVLCGNTEGFNSDIDAISSVTSELYAIKERNIMQQFSNGTFPVSPFEELFLHIPDLSSESNRTNFMEVISERGTLDGIVSATYTIAHALYINPRNVIRENYGGYFSSSVVNFLDPVLSYIDRQIQPEAKGSKVDRCVLVAKLAGTIAQGLNHCVAGIAESSRIAYNMILDLVIADNKFDLFMHRTVQSAFKRVCKFFKSETLESNESIMGFDLLLSIINGRFGMPPSSIVDSEQFREHINEWTGREQLYNYLSNTTDPFAVRIREQLMTMMSSTGKDAFTALSMRDDNQPFEIHRFIISLIVKPENFITFMINVHGFGELMKLFLESKGMQLPSNFNEAVHPDDLGKIDEIPDDNPVEKRKAVRESHTQLLYQIALDMLAQGGYVSLNPDRQ
ncbi:MAG: hypothetical protein LBB21_01240 [Holosporaceae bacterium]|jgi:hypothetical protein|nr:hypothetical protein [Holosporaceae bacterium]